MHDQASVMQKIDRTDKRRCMNLLDLPENLIISILRCLPTKSKCQAEAVCRTFREVLSNPTPGSFVWDDLSLDDMIFHSIPLCELNRRVLCSASRSDL